MQKSKQITSAKTFQELSKNTWTISSTNNQTIDLSIVKTLQPTQNVNISVPKDLYVGRDLYIKDIHHMSDLSLKENIVDISNEKVENLLNVKIKEYTFKHDGCSLIHYGVIAQELELIYPECVSMCHNSLTNQSYKSVNYIELIPLLIKKMQNMQEEINFLRQHCK